MRIGIEKVRQAYSYGHSQAGTGVVDIFGHASLGLETEASHIFVLRRISQVRRVVQRFETCMRCIKLFYKFTCIVFLISYIKNFSFVYAPKLPITLNFSRLDVIGSYTSADVREVRPDFFVLRQEWRKDGSVRAAKVVAGTVGPCVHFRSVSQGMHTSNILAILDPAVDSYAFRYLSPVRLRNDI